MRRKSLIATALLAIATLAPCSAQTTSRLVSLNDGPTPFVALHDPNQNCQVVNRCRPVNFPAVPNAYSGGTAFDPRTAGVWISNGEVLAKVTTDGCAYQCAPIPAPRTPGSFVTGLAMLESRNLLFVVDSAGALTVLRESNCVFLVVSRCRISVTLGANQYFSGLAVDEVNGLLIYSASNFANNSLAQAIHIARVGDPCNPFCAARMTNCATATARLRGITGLAYDPCQRALIATDGSQLVAADLSLSAAGGCSLGNYQCCNPPAISFSQMVGLCIEPGRIESVGTSCTNGACGSCPAMIQTVSGSPSIGNPTFTYELSNAPANSRAFFALGGGPCASPGLNVPGACGPITVAVSPFPPIVNGPFPTGGGGALCNGSASTTISIPLDTALCGDVFSSQWIVICANGSGFGTGISNCLNVTIEGS